MYMLLFRFQGVLLTDSSIRVCSRLGHGGGMSRRRLQRDGRIAPYVTSLQQSQLFWHNAHVSEYLSTTITLNTTDLSYGKTLSLNEADSSGFDTSDSGKTWKVTTINIHAHTFNL